MCVIQRGQIEFEVVYVAPEVDSDDENVEYEDDNGHRYRLYLDELEDNSGAAPPNSSSASLQGEFSPYTCYIQVKVKQGKRALKRWQSNLSLPPPSLSPGEDDPEEWSREWRPQGLHRDQSRGTSFKLLLLALPWPDRHELKWTRPSSTLGPWSLLGGGLVSWQRFWRTDVIQLWWRMNSSLLKHNLHVGETPAAGSALLYFFRWSDSESRPTLTPEQKQNICSGL